MPDVTDRTEIVETRIGALLYEAVGVATAVVAAEDWVGFDHPIGEWFGIRWPQPYEGQVFVAYSPGVIAEQTAWLDDPAFDEYLGLLELLISRGISDVQISPHRDPDERRRALEEELWDHDPEALPWLSRVQLRILDHTADASTT